MEKLYGTTAYGIPISTGPELIDVWNNQIGFDSDGNMVPIDATVIMAHGLASGIGFKTKAGDFTDDDFSLERGDINLLDQKEMAALIFLTCNIAQPGGSIANSIFESQVGIKQVIGADGDVYTTIKSEPVTSGILWWKKTTMVPSLYIYTESGRTDAKGFKLYQRDGNSDTAYLGGLNFRFNGLTGLITMAKGYL